jgi:hypothetical protein
MENWMKYGGLSGAKNRAIASLMPSERRHLLQRQQIIVVRPVDLWSDQAI